VMVGWTGRVSQLADADCVGRSTFALRVRGQLVR